MNIVRNAAEARVYAEIPRITASAAVFIGDIGLMGRIGLMKSGKF